MMEADVALREQIGAFYAYETMLLDENRLREWLELIDDDIRYVMPMRETRLGAPRESTDADLLSLQRRQGVARHARGATRNRHGAGGVAACPRRSGS